MPIRSYKDDIFVSKHEKSQQDYLVSRCDHLIGSLVTDKSKIRNLRNYYEGKRDMTRFAHIREMYGLSQVIDLGFSPLIKPRVNRFVGDYLSDEKEVFVACSDSHTLEEREEEKNLKLSKDLCELTYKKTAQRATALLMGNKEDQQLLQPILDKEKFDELAEKYGEDYISDGELTVYNLIEWAKKDINLGFRRKLTQGVKDLVLTNGGFFRTTIRAIGEDPEFEVVPHEDLFFTKIPRTLTLGEATRAVVQRKYYTKEEIAARWGHLLTQDEKDDLFSKSGYITETRTFQRTPAELDPEHPDHETSPQDNPNLIEVLHTEWLAANEEPLSEDKRNKMDVLDNKTGRIKTVGYRLDRYRCTRINGNIYVDYGLDKTAKRSRNTPWKCKLSYDGVFANSFMESMMELQDLYDIINNFKNNLIANSGTKGTRVNILAIPKALGKSFSTRLAKYIRLKKSGIDLVDMSQEGATKFNNYGEFDETVSTSSIQGIQLVLDSIEAQADSVSGENRFSLGQSEERDSATGIKVGVQQSNIITKELSEAALLFNTLAFTSFIDACQVSLKKGTRLSYSSGHSSKSFSIMSSKFQLSDYNIHLVNTNDYRQKLARIQGLLQEFSRLGPDILSPEDATNIAMSDSVTEIKRILRMAEKRRIKKQNQITQLTDQLEQASQQINQMTQENQRLQAELEKTSSKINQFKQQELELKQRELDIKEREISKKFELDEKKFRVEADIKRERNSLERTQMYIGKGNAKEISNTI